MPEYIKQRLLKECGLSEWDIAKLAWTPEVEAYVLQLLERPEFNKSIQ